MPKRTDLQSILIIGAGPIVTVSYTHLDVYKRQLFHLRHRATLRGGGVPLRSAVEPPPV